MRILIKAETYFQLMVAIQLKLTLFRADEVDVTLSDASVGAEAVAHNLSRSGVFSSVQFVVCHRRTKMELAADLCTTNFSDPTCRPFPLYDEILFYNADTDLYRMLDYYHTVGHEPIWSRFEEGVLSYGSNHVYGTRVQFTRALRRFSSREDIFDRVSRYYCFFPEMRRGFEAERTFRIPSIEETKNELRRILMSVFEFEREQYPQQYLFFASSSDIDGNPIGETEEILRIASIVGKENLLIKRHPRDARHIYEESGLSVMTSSSIPWELAQLCGAAEGKTLLTATSGSFIGITAMMASSIGEGVFCSIDDAPSRLFYQERMKTIASTLERMHDMGLADKLSIRRFG